MPPWEKYQTQGSPWEKYGSSKNIVTDIPKETEISAAKKPLGLKPMTPEEQATVQNIGQISRISGQRVSDVANQYVGKTPETGLKKTFPIGMYREPTGKQLVQGIADPYIKSAIAAGLLTAPVSTAAGLAVGYPIFKGLGMATEKAQSMLPKSVPEELKDLLGVGGELGSLYAGGKITKGIQEKAANIRPIKAIREYPYNKTIAIREGLKESQKSESKLYGKGLKTISKESTEMVSPISAIERMETTLKEKGIIDAKGNRIGNPSNSTEAQYLKSYEIISKKFADSETGNIKIGDIIQESRNIKAKGGKFGTYKSSVASQLSDALMAGVKEEIKSPKFKEMQKRYGEHRETMKPLEEIFKPYENVYKTGKGEKVLGDIYNQPVGTRKLLGKLPEKTGQTIKGAKVISRLQELNPLWWMLKGKRIVP